MNIDIFIALWPRKKQKKKKKKKQFVYSIMKEHFYWYTSLARKYLIFRMTFEIRTQITLM